MSYLLNINTDSDEKKSHKIYSNNSNTFANNLIVQDLDSFFKNVYDYYYYRGYSNVFTQTILDNVSYLFSIHFFILNVYIIDWSTIFKTCINEGKCDLEISDFISYRLIDDYFFSFLVIYTLLISYYFLFLWKSFLFLNKMKKVKIIYDHKLRIKQKEMENLKFDEIIQRLIELQHVENYCRIKQNITKFDVISRILRRENYLIAMITNNVINLKIKIPLIGEKILCTNYLYNNLYDCVLKFAFEKGESRLNEKIVNITMLRFKMIVYMFTEMIFIPATIFFKITFFLFRNAESFSSKKIQPSNRQIFRSVWSNYSQILFRNYNELQHHFEYRIDKSYKPVSKFMNCFKDRRVNIISKFFLIISGSFIILIFIISTIDDRLLTELRIFNKKIVLVGIVIGLIISVFSSGADYNKNSDEDYIENKEYKQKLYREIVNNVINIPCDWRKSTNHSALFKKIAIYYENSFFSLVKEILSVLIFPFIWLRIIFRDTKNIAKFFKFYSKEVNGIGMVYSYSYFDLTNFKFFKERDVSFSEWTYNDRKFLNSLIDYNNKFHNVEEEVTNDEEEIMTRQFKNIEERLLKIYKRENEIFESNTGSTRTKVSSTKRSETNSLTSNTSYEKDSEFLFRSFIHYYISQLNVNQVMSHEIEDTNEHKTLTINDSI